MKMLFVLVARYDGR